MAVTGANRTRASVLPLAIFAFVSLIIYLGGLAAAQRYCTVRSPQADTSLGAGQTVGNPIQVQTNGLNSEGLTGVYGWSGNVLVCASLYRWAWFVFAFVAVTVLGLFIAAGAPHALGTGLHFTRPFWIGMLSISTLLMMIESEAFLAALSSAGLSNTRAYQAAAAGAILTVIALVGLLFVTGTHWDYASESGRKTTGVAGAPYGTTTAAPTAVERV